MNRSIILLLIDVSWKIIQLYKFKLQDFLLMDRVRRFGRSDTNTDIKQEGKENGEGDVSALTSGQSALTVGGGAARGSQQTHHHNGERSRSHVAAVRTLAWRETRRRTSILTAGRGGCAAADKVGPGDFRFHRRPRPPGRLRCATRAPPFYELNGVKQHEA